MPLVPTLCRKYGNTEENGLWSLFDDSCGWHRNLMGNLKHTEKVPRRASGRLSCVRCASVWWQALKNQENIDKSVLVGYHMRGTNFG